MNAGFLRVVAPLSGGLRAYERGPGAPPACGPGAWGAVVAGSGRGLIDSPGKVAKNGGDLTIAWPGVGQPVMMTGPATTVFEGTLDLDALKLTAAAH